jgi:hypothetical protein
MFEGSTTRSLGKLPFFILAARWVALWDLLE